MQEQLISFEVAKLAKEKGFNLEIKTYYNIPVNKKEEPYLETECEDSDNYNSEDYEESRFVNSSLDSLCTIIAAPTQSLLQKWLREVHNIFVVIKPDINIYNIETAQYWESISYINEKGKKGNYIKIVECETYEEALEQGLLYGLKLIE